MKHHIFTAFVADTSGVPRKTVGMYVRLMKAAGLLTSGARGVNAPDMTVLDLVRIIIALSATDRPSEAVALTKQYRAASLREDTTLKISGVEVRWPAGGQLEFVLQRFLSSDPLVRHSVHLEFFIDWGRLEARLDVAGQALVFTADPTVEESEALAEDPMWGIVTRRGFRAKELFRLALPFFLESKEGMALKELLDSGEAQAIVDRAFGDRVSAEKQDD